MEEKHFLVDGAPCSGSLFDFGLFMFTSARRVLLAAAPHVFVALRMLGRSHGGC